MNTMHLRKKTNTSCDGPEASSSRSGFRRGGLRRNNSMSRSFRSSKDDKGLHEELKDLAHDHHTKPEQPQMLSGVGNGVKRLLKGKKLVRVKRVPANGASASTTTLETETEGGETRKVLRVKVKRKPKQQSQQQQQATPNDADSMAPVVRRGRRRNRSDGASVGTGVLSKARSFFTFGGMKLGSGGKDIFDLEGEEEDEDDDRYTQAHSRDDDYDDYDATTMDVRTNMEDATTQKEESIMHSNTPSTAMPALSMSRQQEDQPSSPGQRKEPLRNSSSMASQQRTATIPSKSPMTPKSCDSRRSRRTTGGRRGAHSPAEEIICQPNPPKKQPLTGVALRRLQIQEQWLSKGCNYKPSEFLMSMTNIEDHPEDVSEISYEDPIELVMGIDAPQDQEVPFWTNTCRQYRTSRVFGPSHGRTAESLLNQGVAQLNARQTSQAVDSFLEAVNFLQDKHGENSLAAARGLHLLGSAFFLEGQLPMAVESTRKALEVRKQVLGPFHTDTVDTFSNLAMVYLKMSKLLEAARIFQEVLKIRKAIYDEYHPSVAFPARSLGCVYAKRKDKDRASKSYWHALKCFERHGMLTEYKDTEAEMQRFSIHPPVQDDDDDEARLEI